MTHAAAARPLASISLDLDNLWTYLKIRGEERWSERPSYLDVFVPHALDVLDRLGLKITFFIVGADAEQARNGPALRSIVEAGHEVGNHSFEHEPWLNEYSRDQLREEGCSRGPGDRDCDRHEARGISRSGFQLESGIAGHSRGTRP